MRKKKRIKATLESLQCKYKTISFKISYNHSVFFFKKIRKFRNCNTIALNAKNNVHFFFSLEGLAQLDPKSSGKMGARALTYYFSTTILAAIVGIVLVLIIHPGDPSIKEEVGTGTEEKKVSTLDAFLDLIR